MKGTLVIGFGNTLRCDDGAGVQAAELIAMHYPNVHCLTVHQLTMELAETLSQHSTVVFLDASVTVNKLTTTTLKTDSPPGEYGSHILTPQTLLEASYHLYGCCPERAVQVEIPASDFSFGETISPGIRAHVEQIVREFPQIADSVIARWKTSLPT
jgi:hydrogenase maturation protease